VNIILFDSAKPRSPDVKGNSSPRLIDSRFKQWRIQSNAEEFENIELASVVDTNLFQD
jgi:hypothetical protein